MCADVHMYPYTCLVLAARNRLGGLAFTGISQKGEHTVPKQTNARTRRRNRGTISTLRGYIFNDGILDFGGAALDLAISPRSSDLSFGCVAIDSDGKRHEIEIG